MRRRRLLAPDEKCAERPRVRRHRQTLAQSPRQLDDPPPALWLAQHAAQRCGAAALQVLRHDCVGRDHEVLDELLGTIVLVGLEVREHSAVVDRPRLDGAESQCALLMPQALERLCRAVLDAQLLLHAAHPCDARGRRPRAEEPRGNAVIGEFGAIAHQRAVNVGCRNSAIGRDGHFDDDAEALLVLRERCEVGRQPLGKHRKDLSGRVDAGGIGTGVRVDRGAGSHRHVDIGDRHQDLDRPVARRLGNGQLIEVARVIVVDRAP